MTQIMQTRKYTEAVTGYAQKQERRQYQNTYSNIYHATKLESSRRLSPCFTQQNNQFISPVG